MRARRLGCLFILAGLVFSEQWAAADPQLSDLVAPPDLAFPANTALFLRFPTATPDGLLATRKLFPQCRTAFDGWEYRTSLPPVDKFHASWPGLETISPGPGDNRWIFSFTSFVH